VDILIFKAQLKFMQSVFLNLTGQLNLLAHVFKFLKFDRYCFAFSISLFFFFKVCFVRSTSDGLFEV